MSSANLCPAGPKRKVTLAEGAALLASRDDFLLLTHDHPDGDAVGALVGMLLALRANGKRATAWLPEPPPARYRAFLPTEGLCSGLPAPNLAAFAGTVLCLDFSSPERCPQVRLDHPAIFNLDHHPDNSQFGAWNLVAPEACAAAELIFWLFGVIPGWQLPPEAATALLLGVVMDTGCFRFDNTTSSALITAADLAEAGADYRGIINAMFFAKPEPLARLEADLVLNEMRLEADGRYAWAWVDQELFARHAVAERDTEGLIDVLRAIAGTVIVAIFQRRDNEVRVSLRGKDEKFPVAPLARSFGGGGHALAAGATLVGMDRDQAIAAVRQEVLTLLG